MHVNYDDFAQTFSSSRQDMKWPELEYLVSKVDTNNKKPRVLDVGCGNGRLLDVLDGNTVEYIGIDSSEKMLEEAKRLHPTQTFFLLDMTKLEKLILKDFDYIFFVASFHHLSEIKTREQVVQQAAGLLRDGGMLCMTNWNLLSGVNAQKYSDSKRQGSQNIYLGADFDIKIGEYVRYYHGFTLEELQENISPYLHIQENKISQTENNIITIAIKK